MRWLRAASRVGASLRRHRISSFPRPTTTTTSQRQKEEEEKESASRVQSVRGQRAGARAGHRRSHRNARAHRRRSRSKIPPPWCRSSNSCAAAPAANPPGRSASCTTAIPTPPPMSGPAASRLLLQAQFGDGGGGYSLAGRPFPSYRRLDLKSGESRGWQSDGLLSRDGDGLYGLGGVSISTTLPRQSIYLRSRMPAGSSCSICGSRAAAICSSPTTASPSIKISTDGELGPGYFQYEVTRIDRRAASIRAGDAASRAGALVRMGHRKRSRRHLRDAGDQRRAGLHRVPLG